MPHGKIGNQMTREQKIQAIVAKLQQYTYPADQLGFMTVEEVADKILTAIGE